MDIPWTILGFCRMLVENNPCLHLRMAYPISRLRDAAYFQAIMVSQMFRRLAIP